MLIPLFVVYLKEVLHTSAAEFGWLLTAISLSLKGEPMIHAECELPDRVLKWVIDSVASQANVVSIRRLHGGISSLFHSVSIRVDQVVRNYVLHQFDHMEWLQEEPDIARHEAEHTRTVYRHHKLSLLTKPGAIDCGLPAVLMTELKGSVVLRPQNINHWLDGLAKTLAWIHSLDADDYPWTFTRRLPCISPNA